MEAPGGFPARSTLPRARTMIFSGVSALAQQLGAVNLGQGLPDYRIDRGLIDRISATCALATT
jgi:methionine aminotransferase